MQHYTSDSDFSNVTVIDANNHALNFLIFA